jgi:hypothetical protein
MSRVICAVFLSLTLVTTCAEAQDPLDRIRISPEELRGPPRHLRLEEREKELEEAFRKSFAKSHAESQWVHRLLLVAAAAWAAFLSSRRQRAEKNSNAGRVNSRVNGHDAVADTTPVYCEALCGPRRRGDKKVD